MDKQTGRGGRERERKMNGAGEDQHEGEVKVIPLSVCCLV